jgi:hypothetical protein
MAKDSHFFDFSRQIPALTQYIFILYSHKNAKAKAQAHLVPRKPPLAAAVCSDPRIAK